MTTPLVLSLATQVAQLSPATTTPTARRRLARRARALGRCDLLPGWVTAPLPATPDNDVTPPDLDAICHEVDAILTAKIAARTTPTPALLQLLRYVYLRGLRNAPAPDTAPPFLPPQAHAQARVNTFLAYLDGDPSASAQDADLVPHQTSALVR